MAVITFSRDFGVDADRISEQVAQSLGYSLIDKRVMEKVMVQYGLVTFQNVYNEGPNFWDRFDKGKTEMVSMLNQTIRAFARQDNCVIVGRGGFAVLKDYGNVLHVCITAPFSSRVKHVMETRRISACEQAEALVRENDRVRESFLRTFYNVRHTETGAFSLSINTEQIPMDVASKWIIEAAQILDGKTLDAESFTSSIEVNSVLRDTVAEITDLVAVAANG